jgi:cyclic pyranopterin phosphate synthase
VLLDRFGRQIKDLRISVTDRCNFKCFYCKSAKGVHYVERKRLLTYEEIERLARLLVGLGIRKIRLTGGEPLLRRDLETLVSKLTSIPKLDDLALTTNAFNLSERAERFRFSGLKRVTISLDSLQPDRFHQITRKHDLEKVLSGIRAAKDCGLEPVKVNCVVVRGVNDDEILDFAAYARQNDLAVRFIEFMPLDEDEQWCRSKVVMGDEIFRVLTGRYSLVPLTATDPSSTARNYGFEDSPGAVGLITPVSNPFCGQCSRIRLTADGKVRTCLFSHVEYDAKSLLRRGASDDELEEFFRLTLQKKEEGHRINEPDFKAPARTMSYIGG